MRSTESVVVAAARSAVFPHVADLGAYPAWLPLVHDAVPADGDDDPRPVWDIELRARVGPFARSKQLRMRRTELVDDELAVFERDEHDGRDHARWALRVELTDGDDRTTVVTMHLAYDGSLWTGGLLENVLEDQIRRGRTGLAALVEARPTR
jgi:hypothetical protein